MRLLSIKTKTDSDFDYILSDILFEKEFNFFVDYSLIIK